ncbi:GatB/YqeY domain-containing protein, partial [Photobacterium phosphoreum]|uniref:GatB/YqeY domain-containing protein n=1 Tax=Photobacterium phosphoreum TaxID=659 RepID=UPI001E43FD96
LQEFLPQPLSSQEVDAAIDAAIADANSLGLVGAPAMGKVMAALKTSLAGRADMSAVSGQVKARLIGAK